MRLTNEIKILFIIYSLALFLWFYFTIFLSFTTSSFGYYFQIPLAVVPLYGGISGLLKSRIWGGFKSSMGRALGSLSLGLIMWGLGMVVWNYYIFISSIEVPYPSLADVFFILSWPLWSYGVLQLSKVTGAHFGLREVSGKIYFIFIPIAVIFLSYYLLVMVARGGSIDLSVGNLQLFFDLFYPIGDVVILTIVSLIYTLSRNFLGGVYRNHISLLFLGFVLNYFSDFMFSYTTYIGTYFNGHFVDLMFLTTMFILSVAVNNLGSIRKGL